MKEIQNFTLAEDHRRRLNRILLDHLAVTAKTTNPKDLEYTNDILADELRFLGYIYGFDYKTATSSPDLHWYVIRAMGDVLTYDEGLKLWKT